VFSTCCPFCQSLPLCCILFYGGFFVPVVEGLVFSFVEDLLFLLWCFVVSSCGVFVVVEFYSLSCGQAFFFSLVCGLSFGKLSTIPYDRDQTLEV
jgi:hypothetical protein